jgi:sphinganine C4-monooxygenase
MANTTATYALPPLPDYTLEPLPPLISWIDDAYLAAALPVIAYWAVSMIFHVVDELDLFPQYRLHTPAEVLKRNHVTRWDVFRDVVLQQVIQMVVAAGLTLVDPIPVQGKETYDVSVWAQRLRVAQRTIPSVLGLVGVDAVGIAKSIGGEHAMLSGALAGGVYPQLTQSVMIAGEQTIAPAFAGWEITAAKLVYHFGIPALQFIIAILIVDTWQYFLHRAMHMNKWLYTTFHARHHRLYVPYAYGALYNHPVEGFLLDTCGAGIAYLLTGMTCRQSMWFFTMSTVKTVDNNAGYHDIHHQSWGIKTNFSQPFFTFWDGFLGTKWAGGDVSARYERARLAAQRKVDAESAAAITASFPAESKQQSLDPYAKEASQASSTARSAQPVLEPSIPSGKAAQQALGSRQQVLDDKQSGGKAVLAEESAEEAQAQQQLRRSPRKRSKSSGLKGFADRVGESLQGKGTGVLGVENSSR